MPHAGWLRASVRLFVIGCLLIAIAPTGWAQVPSESDVFVDRGIIAYDSKDYAAALQAFQEALRLNPNNLNALYYTGLTYTASERYPEAQAVLEQAQKQAPTDLDVAFQLAVVYFA